VAGTWRLIDTGLASADRNIAQTRALLEARDADEIPSTLRFLRYTPSALLGCSQSAAQELDLAYCGSESIAIQRRLTGGSAWYTDERQLGWELYLHRREIGPVAMQTVSKRMGHAAATALAALGIDSRCRAQGEIEIDGLTLCMLAHAAEGGAVLLQALLLIDPDVERMLRTLRMPGSLHGEYTDRAPAGARAARLRLTGLRDRLARQPDVGLVRRNLVEAFESEFDAEFRDGELSLTEHARYQNALREIETAGWIDLNARPASDMPLLEGAYKFSGGVLGVALKYETSTRTIREVWFSGDLGVTPRRTVPDLEAALRGVPIKRLGRQVESFFASRPVVLGALEPRDFVAAVTLAAGQPLDA